MIIPIKRLKQKTYLNFILYIPPPKIHNLHSKKAKKTVDKKETIYIHTVLFDTHAHKEGNG